MRIKKTFLMAAVMAVGALEALNGAPACRLGVGMECLDRDLEPAVSKSAAAVPSAQKTHE